jgi:hypothetical protein
MGMHYRLAITITAFFFAWGDIPRGTALRPSQPASPEALPPGESIPFFTDALTTDTPPQEKNEGAPPKPGTALQESSKLALIRYVSGEFAKARKPVPGGKDGFIIYVDKPLNEQYLDRVIATHGAAVNSGDNVQITGLEFHDRSIVVDLNGGGRPKKHWRDRIQVSMGGSNPIPQSTAPTVSQDPGPPGFQPGMGGTIYIDFPQHVPDMTPDQLKQILAPFLDFAKERSASVHWIDTLPPEMKKAITDRHAIPGMDREEVVAALGKPDRKVRERDSNGNDTEDWIYGHPPDKTIFVHFTGEKVTTIKQYPP